MTHQVPEHYSSVSERLSKILDNVGYSREDRERKVRVATECEVFYNMAWGLERILNRYIFGSRGEGSTGPGLQSDLDILDQFNNIKVVTHLCQCQPEMTNFLMVKENHTHPGYVKLQRIAILSGNTPALVYLERYNDDLTAINSLKKVLLSNTIHHNHGTVSGPALHDDSTMVSIDTVRAVRCSQWPQEGYEWFQRRRLNGWPTNKQIKNARKYGCFVTPVGHSRSSECHLEWRLSFSIAEREITRSFEDTTMKVYILLKMIRKTYIEPVIGDAFSSYHCKVCMLWMREKTPGELWNNGNLLYCLNLCIRQIYEWVKTGFCPDYFIVTNNIYDRKIVGTVRFNLEQMFGYLLSDCTFFLGIECCNLGQCMADETSRFDCCIIPIAEEEKVDHIMTVCYANKCRHSILHNIPQHYSTLVDYLDRIMYASKCLPHVMQYPLKFARKILWSHLGFCIATICKENADSLSREQIYFLVGLASDCLSFGINSDTNSVRLKLCGLGMELENHNLIETSLQYISDYHMTYIFSATMCEGNMSETYIETLCRNRYNTEQLLQTQTSFGVVYLPSEISITPKPMRMEMFKSIGVPPELRKGYFDYWFDWVVVDSLICLYFFQYLNFSRQSKERQKQVAVDNMIHVISTELGILHRDTAFNILGYSFTQEHQLTNAYRCFMESLKIRSYYNAAKIYLGILFKRIHATDRGHTHYEKRRSDISN